MTLKIITNEELGAPIWKGTLDVKLTPEDINLEIMSWNEVSDKCDLMTNGPASIDAILDYFEGETVLDDLLAEGLGSAFYEEWHYESLTDPAFLKKALQISTTIQRYRPGYVNIPCADSRSTFGKIVVTLDNYLLTPPHLFVGNNDWPATDVIYETDPKFLDTVFYLNSSKFGTALENKSKQPMHVLICDLRLDPLFMAK
tara:strand:+ start:2070 stop:2669 length:600 start_codon:yes stop_codon:yes gene_type:complete